MIKLRQNKGITLIALIITIIVMLILVGVTVNVALNGNLFGKAEYASEQMQIEVEKEELLSAVMGAIGNDGKIKFGEIQLPEGWSKVADKTYRSPKDNMYKVDDYGKIEYIGKYTGGGSEPVAFSWEDVGLTVDTSTEYISEDGLVLNFSVDGKLVMLSSGMVMATVDATNSDNIDETTGNLSFDMEIEGTPKNVVVTMNTNNVDIDIAVEGMGTFTCVKVELDSESEIRNVYSNAEVLQALGETGGEYKGTWTVIERDASGNPTKLVSTSEVAYCELGEDSNLEKSISDYKNAVSILNTAAETATGITGARSITIEDIETLAGIEDSDKGDNYNQTYTYNYTNHKDQVFVNESGDTVKLDTEGEEVSLKHTYYSKTLSSDEIGTLASGYYWLASPCVDCYSDNASFRVRCMGYGGIYYGILFYSNGNAYDRGSGVRAVVSVSGL
ncbi:MAG: hypothetical protein ACI4UX_03855 [Clostridia bacterium]